MHVAIYIIEQLVGQGRVTTKWCLCPGWPLLWLWMPYLRAPLSEPPVGAASAVWPVCLVAVPCMWACVLPHVPWVHSCWLAVAPTNDKAINAWHCTWTSGWRRAESLSYTPQWPSQSKSERGCLSLGVRWFVMCRRIYGWNMGLSLFFNFFFIFWVQPHPLSSV